MPRPFDARLAYNRIGRLQDTQSFYERGAVDALLALLDLGTARQVVEIGCGTGKLAERLVRGELPSDARHLGTDVSDRMVHLTGQRIAVFGDRARVVRVEPGSPLPPTDRPPDRIIAAYVFDLLSESEMADMLGDVGRRLAPDGLLGIVALTEGSAGAGRWISDAWRAIWERFPAAVGGCRPVELEGPIRTAGFELVHRATTTSWAISSSIVVASAPT